MNTQRLVQMDRTVAEKIHEEALKRFGGLPGVRDEKLLESALSQPWQTYGGQELYPSLEQKAAQLAYGIIKNHPFFDGNKRTGAALMATLMRLGGHPFRPDPQEFQETILAVASGQLDASGLCQWLESLRAQD